MGTFGERLREIRILRGVTQEELAEMADIARTMIGRYETTDQLPAIDTLVRVADALGVSTDYLLGRTDSVDAPFSGGYAAPPKPPRSAEKLPRNVGELEALIREIVTDILKENTLPDPR